MVAKHLRILISEMCMAIIMLSGLNPKKDSHIINGNDGGCNITYDNGEHWFFANTPPVGPIFFCCYRR
jgi:hypothetical protein